MKTNCPYCSVKLRWKLVRAAHLSGQQNGPPERGASVCPSCGGELVVNGHWSEFVAELSILIPFIAALLLGPAVGNPTLRVAILATLIFWAAVFGFFHFRYWRHMQRYRKQVEDAA